MTDSPDRERRTIEVAERVCEILEERGIASAVIGAMALAVYGFVRATRDFDLACCADPFSALRDVRRALEEAGRPADLRLPDAEDPLGGVLEVAGPDLRPIQVVNYYNPLRAESAGAALAREAVGAAEAGLIAGSRLRVVRLPHLVALKLYAGGPKSRNDVIELLERNRPLEVRAIFEVCARHGLSRELEGIVAELGLG